MGLELDDLVYEGMVKGTEILWNRTLLLFTVEVNCHTDRTDEFNTFIFYFHSLGVKGLKKALSKFDPEKGIEEHNLKICYTVDKYL